MSGLNIIQLAQAVLAFAKAADDVTVCKSELKDAYYAWRSATGTREYIRRGSVEWNAMMVATAGEYQQLLNAKARERRAKRKLLVLAATVEGVL